MINFLKQYCANISEPRTRCRNDPPSGSIEEPIPAKRGPNADLMRAIRRSAAQAGISRLARSRSADPHVRSAGSNTGQARLDGRDALAHPPHDRIDVLVTGGDQFEASKIVILSLIQALTFAVGQVRPLQDKGEGRYLVSYRVRDQAQWTIDVLVDGSPIQSSPFTPAFDAGATDPSQCHVIGECFEQDIEAGTTWRMSLISKA